MEILHPFLNLVTYIIIQIIAAFNLCGYICFLLCTDLTQAKSVPQLFLWVFLTPCAKCVHMFGSCIFQNGSHD